jgi:hypothetical protein
MKLMSAAKVGEGNHGGQQSDAAPPEVCASRAAEVTVNAFMGHHRAEKNQVRAEQNVEREMKAVRDGNEQRADCQQTDNADNRAVEVVNL